MKRICSLALTLILILGLAGCAQKAADAPTWQEQYDLGIKYLEEGNYEEAIIAFNAAIEIDPKRPEAYIGLADVYTALGDTDAAKKALEDGLAATEDDSVRARLEQLEAQLSAAAIPQVGPAVDPLPVARTEERDGYVYEYDENGRLIREAFYLYDGTLLDWERTFLYDAAGLLVSSRATSYAEYYTGNPADRYTDSEYDGLGRLIKRVDEDVQLYDGISFLETHTYRYDGTRVEITIDGSEPGTALPVWKWAVIYTMSDPGHAVKTGNMGYGQYVELREYDWVEADPIAGYYGLTVNNAAYDGNGNQLPWSDGWYLDFNAHPEWWYNP